LSLIIFEQVYVYWKRKKIIAARQALPSDSKLVELKLYETKDSFARSIDNTTLGY